MAGKETSAKKLMIGTSRLPSERNHPEVKRTLNLPHAMNASMYRHTHQTKTQNVKLPFK